MARPTIRQIREVGDFLTVYQWDMSMTLPSKVSGGIDSAAMNIRCTTTDIPKRTGASIKVAIRGHEVKQPGIYTYSGTQQFTFVEAVDMKIFDLIQKWGEACSKTDTGEQEKKKDVEATVKIIRLDRQNKPVWEYTLFGCYLEDYDNGGALSESSSEVSKPQLTLSYDFFEQKKL